MKHALKYNEELKNAGFTPNESKTLIHVWEDVMESQLVTKEEFKSEMGKVRGEVNLLATELRSEMEQLRSEIQSDMKELEVRLTLRLGGIMLGGVAVMGIIVQLPHLLK